MLVTDDLPQNCRCIYPRDKELFLKQVSVLTEREKQLSLDVSGDFYTIQEMKDELHLVEIFGPIGTSFAFVCVQACLLLKALPQLTVPTKNST